MNFYSTPSPYPWDAFHLVSREAIEEVVRHVQAPVALIAMEFLANMSAATQGLYDVHLPTGQTCPTSLYESPRVLRRLKTLRGLSHEKVE